MKIDKRGTSEMTTRKLVGIVIVLLVLFVVIVMISSGIIPNLEQIEGKFNEVLKMMNFGNDFVSIENCPSDSVYDLTEGREFLKRLGIEGKVVNFILCSENRMCTFQGEGLNLYRSYKWNFQKLESGEWKGYDSVMTGDFEQIKRNWEFYHAGVDFLEGLDLKDVYDESVSSRLVLYGDGWGWNSPITASWQNGVWRVIEGDVLEDFNVWYKDGEVEKEDGWVEEMWFEDVSGGGRVGKKFKVFTSEDNKEAIGAFVNVVWNGKKLGFHDKVYWKIVTPERNDVDYLSSPGQGESIRYLVSAPVEEVDSSFDNRYNSIVAAEHRNAYDVKSNSLKESYDPWIRTNVRNAPGGSSAYGPAQLTKSLAQGYLENHLNGGKIAWTSEEIEYLKKFIKQGELFLKWGNSVPANGIDPNSGMDVRKYDYGGSGDLTSEEDKVLYERVVKKMLSDIYSSNDDNEREMWIEWRHGGSYRGDVEERYGEAFMVAWKQGIRKSSVDEGGSPDKIDREVDVENLEIEVAKIVSRLSWKSRLSDKGVENLREVIEGKNLDVGGKKFALSVEDSEGFPVISFIDGKNKFGFIHDGNAKINSGLLPGMKLRYFPIKLVEFRNGVWADLGNEEYYRFYEKDFKEVYRTGVVAGFLKERCK